MPRWLLSLLKGIWAGIKSLLAERERLGKVADQGAEDQRAADEGANKVLEQEIKDRRDEIHDLPDDDFAKRRDKWVC